ncbi:EGF domain-specific O-linked N-acetylglucosamine transferase-like isoform X3 [Clavelina lepadiformis]|uniref:EGF domain-specific O-linked N-acetylglucosamine transferase-like isoform X3 n=1 Tax=Clavelina lepadiformis TaxID=159417 RepID=UPI0040433AFB
MCPKHSIHLTTRGSNTKRGNQSRDIEHRRSVKLLWHDRIFPDMQFFIVVLLLSVAVSCVDLPLGHLSIYRNRILNAQVEVTVSGPTCYGYEKDCNHDSRFETKFPSNCKGSKNWRFWFQGDFGYIGKRLDELTPMCDKGISSLQCTNRMQFCKAQNLFLDLRSHYSRHYPDHKQDIFSENEIGGDCDVYSSAISRQETPNVDGGLRSWFPELKTFSKISDYKRNHSNCDIVINKPVVFMKLDQGENMYHHMCDFLNLYMSLHVNGSIAFDRDFIIVNWYWLKRDYVDFFTDSWQVFTEHPIVYLRDWFGKRVCIRNAIFSLLPRMIQGIYYNTQLGEECVGTGLVKSFSQFFLHRLKIEEVVEFKRDEMTFLDQLILMRNTDIFIAVHGAGLTHLLFLPDGAVVFELYDCESICFRDLARLRGLRHLTWLDSSKMTKHKRTNNTNYENNYRYYDFTFDKDEFRRLFLKAASLFSQATAVHNEL